MDDLVTLQELFDSQATFSPAHVGLMLDINKLWESMEHETSNPSWSLSYHEKLQAVADKHGLNYDLPKHMGSLKAVEGVGSPTTIH